MTGVRESVELTDRPVIPAVPDRVRLSFLGGHTQVDVALPLDVPVAALVPQLLMLVRSRESDHPDSPFSAEARRSVWELSRADGGTPAQCDGRHDAAFAKTVKQRACAWRHPSMTPAPP